MITVGTNMTGIVKQIVNNALAAKNLEREISFVVDVLVCIAITVMPRVGVYLSLVYYLFRDALPMGRGMSLGKSVYGLRVVMAEDGRRASWQKVFVRNLITFIPLLNLYDVYLFLTTGSRVVDQWSGTTVVKMTD